MPTHQVYVNDIVNEMLSEVMERDTTLPQKPGMAIAKVVERYCEKVLKVKKA